MTDRTVAIVDDEAPARSLLKEYLSGYPELKLIAECKNGVEAIGIINVLKPSLVFLDIQMPGKSGFEVLGEIEHIPRIIFTTAYDKYALEAFNVNAVDYLLKPYTQSRFAQALEKVLVQEQNLQLQQLPLNAAPGSFPERVLVEQGNKLLSIAVQDILWLEADGDYTRIHTLKQTFLSSKGISELEQRLNPQSFQRIHRSAIISLGGIQEVLREPSGPQIRLKNDVLLKVSRTYVEALRKFIY